MKGGDFIAENRTFARNRVLKSQGILNAEKHNERKNDAYSNSDIVTHMSEMNVHYKKPTASYEEMFAQLEQQGVISTRGLKPDADHFCELIFDVNSAYFHNNGGYGFAKKFYADAYKAAIEIVGGEQFILSAVMHADEKNRAMSDALGQDVYHYHMHVVYVPVVEKKVLWTKRCKDPTLVGKVKEVIMQVSRSKKWASRQAVDENGALMFSKNGKPILKPSYSLLQDLFHKFMQDAGYTDLKRGQRGSTEEHLTVTQFKVMKEQERLMQQQEQLAEIEDRKLAAAEDLHQLEKEKKKADKQLQQTELEVERLAPKVKNLNDKLNQYRNDPNEALPEAGTLESGKAYREKKAIPLVQKLLNYIFGLRNKVIELERKVEKLMDNVRSWKGAYDRAMARLEESRFKADRYDRLRRLVGESKIEEVLSREPIHNPQQQTQTQTKKGALR